MESELRQVYDPSWTAFPTSPQRQRLLATPEARRLRELPPGTYTVQQLSEIARQARESPMSTQQLLGYLQAIYASAHWPQSLENKVLIVQPDRTIWVGPEINLVEGREVTFEEAREMIEEAEVISFILDPMNQEELRPGNTRVTLIGVNGREYDVVAQYDPRTGQIFPPA